MVGSLVAAAEQFDNLRPRCFTSCVPPTGLYFPDLCLGSGLYLLML